MLELDHVAVLGETLEAAVAHCEQALGIPMGPGGVHARFGTHNRLLGMDPGLYLEAISVDPAAPAPQEARWFGLDHFRGVPRLDKWICRVPDIEAALRALPEAGRPVEVSRGALRWTMAVPEDGRLPFDGLFPALIQWHVDVLPGQTLAGAGMDLRGLVVSHPRADALRDRLAPVLSAPLVSFESAAVPGLRAELQGPDGRALVLT